MRIVVKNDVYDEIMDFLSKSENAGSRLEYFKRKLIEHLNKLEAEEEKEIHKAEYFLAWEDSVIKSGFDIGTVREWKGKKYRKIAPGKWRLIYESDSRGTKQAIAHVKRQIENAKDFKELGEIVSQNMMRFTVNGAIIPIAKEVLEAAKGKQMYLHFNRVIEAKPSTIKQDVLKYKGKTITYKGKQYQIGDYEAGDMNIDARVWLTQYGDKKASLTEKEFYDYTKEIDNKMYHIGSGGNGGDEPPNDGRFEFTPELKSKALDAMNNPTEKINYVDYTRENYNKLFPRGMCKTPIGTIKLSPNQFERLETKDNGERIHFLGALQQCLQRPDVIIGKTDNKDRYSKLYLKAFLDNDGKKSYLAVVPKIDGIDVVVSNSPRDTSSIVKEIKKAGLCYYIRPALTSSANSVGGSRMENSVDGLTSNNSRNEAVKPSDNSTIPSSTDSVNEKYSDEMFYQDFKNGKFKQMADEVGEINSQSLHGKITEQEKGKKYAELYKKIFPTEPNNIKQLKEKWFNSANDEITQETIESGKEQAKKMSDDFLKEKIEQFKKVKPVDIVKKNEKSFEWWVLNHLAKNATKLYADMIENPLSDFNIPYEPKGKNYNKRKELALKILEDELKSRGKSQNNTFKKSILEQTREILKSIGA